MTSFSSQLEKSSGLVSVRVRVRDSDFIFQSIGEKLQFSVSYFPLQSAVEKLKVRVRVRVRVRV